MIRRLCLLAVFVLGLVGCRPADDGTPRVRIWHQKTGAERDFFNEAVARFNAAQDTLVIEPLYRVLEDDYLNRFTDEGVVSWNGEPWMLADQLGNHLVFVYNQALMPEP